MKWCQPVDVISDDSSSSEDDRVKLCYPVHSEGHKFSDGIVWETIEEEEEEVSSSESDNNEVTMNVAESENMKIDLNEGDLMLTGDTPGKKEAEHHHQSHEPFITEQTFVNKPERGSVGYGSVGDMDNTEEVTGLDCQSQSAETEPGEVKEEEEEDEEDIDEEEAEEAEEAEEEEDEEQEDPDDLQYELKDEQKEYPVTREELGNISVKNLAKFWEEVSRKVRDETERAEPVIEKKWTSLPNLKEKYEKRRLPAAPVMGQQLATVQTNIVKSDEIIDDVDLCRSVSLRDRKELFETLSRQAKKEKAKQWSSMPSLKQERRLPDLPSPGRTRVRWEDEEGEEQEEQEVEQLGVRGRSPVRELMKSFELLPQQSSGYQRSPASPQIRTNEVFGYKDENYSSSDSVSSSMTCSSLSTVITRSARPASQLEESTGEIYTESDHRTEQGLYVLENGMEYSLTPLTSRKSKFESLPTSTDRIRPKFTTVRVAPKSLSSRPYQEPQPTNMERVKSSSVPYIEEEKDVLKNINIVKSLKTKFLN